jgi:tricorn protease
MTLINSAYLKNPSLQKDIIVFVTDDDLWSVSRFGGEAKRLTNLHGLCREPHISPDGTRVAFLSNDKGQYDIYVIPIQGGQPQRVTYKGINTLNGWQDKNTLRYASNCDAFSPRVTFLYDFDLRNHKETPLNLGHASCLVQDGMKRILGRNIGDPARWKRYRGGTAGTLWLDEQGKDNFKKFLPKLKTNLANPLWIDGRIYFISDHEGVGNIYSALPSGRGLKRHTHCDPYYVRSFSYDNGLMAFQSGANIFLLELKTDTVSQVDINVPSSFNQSTARIEEAEDFLQEFTLAPQAQEVAYITRGQLFHNAPWNSAPLHKGNKERRYKMPLYVENKKDKKSPLKLLAIELNEENEETVKLFSLDTKNLDHEGKTIAQKQDWGKIVAGVVNPENDSVAISNNRNELYHLHTSTGRVDKISDCPYGAYYQYSWSRCGRYLAYGHYVNRDHMAIFLYDTKTKKSRELIPSVLHDFSPCFSEDGHYLYFLGIRNFHPIYSETHFELSFPLAVEAFALCLKKDIPSPLDLYHNFEKEEDEGDEEENAKKSKAKPKAKRSAKDSDKKEDRNDETQIDFDGLENRIVKLPIPMGGHRELACAGDKIFILRHNLSGRDGDPTLQRMPSPSTDLYWFDLKENKFESFQKHCTDFEISLDQDHIILDSQDGLRLVSTEAKPSDGEGTNKKDGYLSLDHLKLEINPKNEWRQMYQEAWILQREHFWTKDMNKVNWQKVYKDYLPLLEKVHTRFEFSDLMWEMQGELGTSHCYEFGGDYFRNPFSHQNGDLAADLTWNERTKSYTIGQIAQGDSWVAAARSPLLAPNVALKSGDQILGYEGRPFEDSKDLYKVLEGRVSKKLSLTIKRKGSPNNELVEVKPLRNAHLTRYRDWVEANKKYVHQKSKGKFGYVHVPDMGLHGFSEFYRNFLTEVKREGLIVDVRYNGGGHVSQHILKILAQKLVGFDKTRYMDIEPYPQFAINGPVVALTNEHAGSDGDIFSHSFKLMEIGPLIGTRTWGGVVGIWPRHPLNDGTITSQPEFSSWFKDVGYGVENYGTDPDIEVERMPKDWKKGNDPQLDRGISEAIKLHKKNPPLKPNLNQDRPNLRAPKLPHA